MADVDGLILRVLPVADSDVEELADLAAELHAELLSVDGTSVAPVPAEAGLGSGSSRSSIHVWAGTWPCSADVLTGIRPP